jgi:epoxyqueuosine reductase QueG
LATLTDKVKSLALSSGMDYVGIATVERFNKAPKGWRPTDLMKSCKSIISVGVKIGEGVKQANRQAFDGHRNCIYIYQMFGYVFLNNKLNSAVYDLSRFLEKKGYISIPIPASDPSDPYELKGVFSHRHAAVAAGIGELGWNGLLVTPNSGPRVRLATLLTSAELDPDSMYTGKKLCNKEKCGVCISVCPVDAISKNENVKLEIGGRTFEHAKLNKIKCRYGIHGLTEKALGRRDIKMPRNPRPEDFLKALRQESPWQSMERVGSMCGRCMINCPIPKI